MNSPRRAGKPRTDAMPAGDTLFPMRINKYVASRGYSTRKGADDLVARGVVFVNGQRAVLGQMVHEGDKVELRRKGKAPSYVYLICNKPVGMPTHREHSDDLDVGELVPKEYRSAAVFPVGRLDKWAEGLLLLTNDGRITDRLLNPKYHQEQTYDVRTKLPLRSSFQEKMEQGGYTDGEAAQACSVEITGERSFRVTIRDGKGYAIRRTVAALFNEVVSLKRISIMHIRIGTLASSGCRALTERERENLLKELGLLN